jgi:hypothetical protein
MDSQFVLGVIVSEGCFTINLQNREAGGLRATYRFEIKMSEEDEELVREIQRELGGVGGIYREEREKWTDTVALVVTGKVDIDEVIAYIEENRKEAFDNTRKAEQYGKWKEARRVGTVLKNKDAAQKVVDIAAEIDKYDRGLSKSEWMQRF